VRFVVPGDRFVLFNIVTGATRRDRNPLPERIPAEQPSHLGLIPASYTTTVPQDRIPAGGRWSRIRLNLPFAAALLIAAIAGVGALLWVSRPPGWHLVAGRSPQSGVDALVHRRVLLGHSVRGRPIVAVELGDPDAPRRLLVVGAIHGNESAGVAIARELEHGSPPRQAMLWIVPDLNPDGVAADRRQNARGVDLNRNFSWHWHHLGRRGDLQYSGTRALSEPESRIARDLILRVRPQITIWFHQPLAVVDESGGSIRVESSFARRVGLPLTRLQRYPGSAASWQNHRLRGSTAFVVELPPGSLSPSLKARSTSAILKLTRQ
jgi:protein MpaA